jgi:hypothetical protein
MNMSNESELDQLYKDAYISHLIRQGYTDYLAEVEANRRIIQKSNR